MRIVHIITRLIIGGAQENTVLTCRGLAQHGHEVTILTGPETGPEGDMFATAKDYGIRLGIIKNLRRDISPYRDIAAIPELVLALRRLAPDVVHTHCSKAGILGRLAARLAGVKVVVHTIHGLPFFSYQSRITNQAYILAERIAWMRAYVRFETCKWFRSYRIPDDQRQIGTNTDGDCRAGVITDYDGGVSYGDGCSQKWEPKEEP